MPESRNQQERNCRSGTNNQAAELIEEIELAIVCLRDSLWKGSIKRALEIGLILSGISDANHLPEMLTKRG
jgi:hypothetical protein